MDDNNLFSYHSFLHISDYLSQSNHDLHHHLVWVTGKKDSLLIFAKKGLWPGRVDALSSVKFHHNIFYVNVKAILLDFVVC
jgi:hypothetical protein